MKGEQVCVWVALRVDADARQYVRDMKAAGKSAGEIIASVGRVFADTHPRLAWRIEQKVREIV